MNNDDTVIHAVETQPKTLVAESLVEDNCKVYHEPQQFEILVYKKPETKRLVRPWYEMIDTRA